MSTAFEQFWAVIFCDSKEQSEWLVKRLEEEEAQCDVEVEENDVVVHWDGNGEAGNFTGVAHAVAAFQKQFKVMKPWIGSYGLASTKPILSYSGAVVVYRGKEHWINATKLAKAKAKELTRKAASKSNKPK